MARFRKIDVRIWNDSHFSALPNRGKLAFFYLLTHPHLTMLGAMKATLSGMAEELSWKTRTLKAALLTLCEDKSLKENHQSTSNEEEWLRGCPQNASFEQTMLKWDPQNAFIWLPNFLKYNKPESPNVIKGWQNALDYLPECPLKDQLIQHARAYAEENLPKSFQVALPWAFRKGNSTLRDTSQKPFANQEQEQEQEQEQNNTYSQAADAAQPITAWDSSHNVVVEGIFEHWQKVMDHPNAVLDGKRRGAIQRALKLGYSEADLKKSIDGCKHSKWNMGDNPEKRRYDDITLILRDAGHIEGFKDGSGGGVTTAFPNEDIFEGAI